MNNQKIEIFGEKNYIMILLSFLIQKKFETGRKKKRDKVGIFLKTKFAKLKRRLFILNL